MRLPLEERATWSATVCEWLQRHGGIGWRAPGTVAIVIRKMFFATASAGQSSIFSDACKFWPEGFTSGIGGLRRNEWGPNPPEYR